MIFDKRGIEVINEHQHEADNIQDRKKDILKEIE